MRNKNTPFSVHLYDTSIVPSLQKRDATQVSPAVALIILKWVDKEATSNNKAFRKGTHAF